MAEIKVLYVEDEPFLAKIVMESLESRDYEVKLVMDGGEVMEAFMLFQPDICVLDVMLPNQDGFSIGKEIQARNPQMPIIFLTAKTQTEDLVKGFASGGNDYIRKPFSMEELIIRMDNLLQLVGKVQVQSSPEADCIAIGNYQFFPLKYELHWQEEVKSLSHRENQLLRILARHINFTVERKTILKEVWGDDSFFNSRNLDVYITRLRDYLKKDGRVKIITLKGVGYHVVVE
ncbi:MAG: response regulator transcription factor [Bacteroidota bacterium]